MKKKVSISRFIFVLILLIILKCYIPVIIIVSIVAAIMISVLLFRRKNDSIKIKPQKFHVDNISEWYCPECDYKNPNGHICKSCGYEAEVVTKREHITDYSAEALGVMAKPTKTVQTTANSSPQKSYADNINNKATEKYEPKIKQSNKIYGGVKMDFPKDYTVIDIETTGLPQDSEIIEIAAVRVRDDLIVDEFETLINPSITISQEITGITGITNEMVSDSPSFENVLNGFLSFIGDDVLVGHNIDNFDMKIISLKALRTCGVVIDNNTVDTMKLSRKMLSLNHHKLSDLCRYYGVKNENAHRAMSDVIATYECYQHLKNGDIGVKDFEKDSIVHKSYHTDETKALQTLQGMLMGVTCDNVLVESEVMFIKNWLEENKELSGNYPFDVAYSEIEKAYEDGVLEPDELKSLLNTFIKLINPVQSNADTEEKSDKSNLSLYGITVCLSGEFKHGTKEEISELLAGLGATVKNTLTKKVKILIVGDNGSDAWNFGNYGRKIKEAIERQKQGDPIEIISETDFYKKLDKINAQNNQIVFEETDESLALFLSEMVEAECIKQGIASSFIKIIKNTNDSQSIWICDPVWMLDFEGKQTQNALSVGKKKKGYEVILSIGRNELNDFVPVPEGAEIKNTIQNNKNKTSVLFAENNDSLKKYISDVFAWELKHFMPSYQFGCCSKYVECSDAKKCLHQNSMYARGCYYRKNLEAGKIFYGKNCNVD